MMARDATSQKKELSVLVGSGLWGEKILGEATAAASRISVKVKSKSKRLLFELAEGRRAIWVLHDFAHEDICRETCVFLGL